MPSEQKCKRRPLRVAIVCLFCAALLALSLCVLTACHKQLPVGNDGLAVGSRPDYKSIFLPEQIEFVRQGMAEDATPGDLKRAAMTLYNVANQSRKTAANSLMLQSSSMTVGGGVGTVIMRGFNLKQGEEWFYQLATEIDSPLSSLLEEFGAGFVKVGYKKADGEIRYVNITGQEPQSHCDIQTFPYGDFDVTQPLETLTEEQFAAKINYLDNFHEITNLDFCEEILTDINIAYDEAQRLYKLSFAVDVRNTYKTELLEKWFRMASRDMQASDPERYITSYVKYTAELEVWDNGYAKSFTAFSNRNATKMGSGQVNDSFSFLWKEDEILTVLSSDERIDDIQKPGMKAADYMAFYRDVAEHTSTFVGLKFSDKLFIGLGTAAGALAILAIVYFAVTAALIKKGKLKKLAAARAQRSAKRFAKKRPYQFDLQ